MIRSEINAVKYSDVDYINRTLTVQRQSGQRINTKKEDFAPKTFTKQEISDFMDEVLPKQEHQEEFRESLLDIVIDASQYLP